MKELDGNEILWESNLQDGAIRLKSQYCYVKAVLWEGS